MLITAHGGALKTKKNHPSYFEAVKNLKIDIIEVDIFKTRKGLLYISHNFKLFPAKAMPLSFVFEFAKAHNFRINCDMKQRGIEVDILDLAKEYGAEDRVIFTGYAKNVTIAAIDRGEIYQNTEFGFTKASLGSEKAKMDRLNNERIKGININYKLYDKSFYDEAKKHGVKLSVYTVDNYDMLKWLIENHPEIDNITTNIPDKALKLLGR